MLCFSFSGSTCSEPSCKPSPHWQRGTHSSLWRKWGWQERPDTANSQLATSSDGNCRCREPSCKPSFHWRRGTHSSTRRELGWQERPGFANNQLATATAKLPAVVVGSDSKCREPACKPSPYWQIGTHPSLERESGARRKGQALPTAIWQLPAVSPVHTGIDTHSPQLESGAGKKDQALPTAS